MQRSTFLQHLTALGACPFMLANMAKANPSQPNLPKTATTGSDSNPETTFIENWLSDLLDSMENTIDRETQARIIAGCGRGCYNRHSFKQDIAAKGRENLDELLKAYHQYMEAWVDGEKIHIRFGEVSSRCYCPVVQHIKPKPNDLHCECTRATQQSILENAFGRPMKVEIVETLRRGGKTCHFVADYKA